MNSGTFSVGIEAGVQFSAGLASVVVDNSGAIDGATIGLGHGTDGTMALTHSGTTAGDVTGVASDAGGAAHLVNRGTTAGETRSEERHGGEECSRAGRDGVRRDGYNKKNKIHE